MPMTHDELQAVEAAKQSFDDFQTQAMATLHRAHAIQGGDDPIEIDENGIMHGRDVTYIKTVRTSPLATLDGNVDAIVWHWTDTRGAGAVNLATRIAKAGASRSCHEWIDAKGIIAQSASAKVGTWHAGSDSCSLFTKPKLAGEPWVELTPAQRGKLRGYGANSFAWGVEIENIGELRLIAADARALALGPNYIDGGKVWAGWPFQWSYRNADGSLERPAVAPIAEVFPVDHRGYHKFTEPQIVAAGRSTSALARRYGLTREACSLGHAQLDPKRRTDPGPLWLGRGADGKRCPGAYGGPTRGHLDDILDAIF